MNKAAVSLFPFTAVVNLFDGTKAMTLLAALLLIALSVFIRRPTGTWAGALDVAVFLADWFEAWDSLFVAAALVAVIGLATILQGVKAHLTEDRLDTMLPAPLRRLRPAARTDPVTFGF